MFYLTIYIKHDISVQNRIIDDIFNVYEESDLSTDVVNNISISNESVSIGSNILSDDYLGYIFIPRFDIKRLIKSGTKDNILNGGYVGMHRLSGSLDGSDLVILAGHNVSNVFSKLHHINNGDSVFINTNLKSRKFIVYDKKTVSEYDIGYLDDNRNNELLLITCTKKKGERLIVFLREEL